jgi:hypothetical protein
VDRDNWCRNTSWSDAIEAAFFRRLARAQKKSQYLLAQASLLTSSHPQVALRLLDQYFALGDDLLQAQAHVERARVLAALRNVNAAIDFIGSGAAL